MSLFPTERPSPETIIARAIAEHKPVRKFALLSGGDGTASVAECMVDDVTQVCQRVPFIERYPARLWDVGLISELAEASDRLAAKVAKLQEAQGADR